MANCDIDDILCQMRALNHLQGLKEAVGDEKFKTDFPELENLSDILNEKINLNRATLKESLEKCGMPEPEELEEGE